MTKIEQRRKLLAELPTGIEWKNRVPIDYRVTMEQSSLEELESDWGECPDSVPYGLLKIIRAQQVLLNDYAALLEIAGHLALQREAHASNCECPGCEALAKWEGQP